MQARGSEGLNSRIFLSLTKPLSRMMALLAPFSSPSDILGALRVCVGSARLGGLLRGVHRWPRRRRVPDQPRDALRGAGGFGAPPRALPRPRRQRRLHLGLDGGLRCQQVAAARRSRSRALCNRSNRFNRFCVRRPALVRCRCYGGLSGGRRFQKQQQRRRQRWWWWWWWWRPRSRKHVSGKSPSSSLDGRTAPLPRPAAGAAGDNPRGARYCDAQGGEGGR